MGADPQSHSPPFHSGHELYTWCAPDTLLFPAIIGRAAQIESPCPATGTPVRLTVDPHAGVTALDPPTAVVAIANPKQVNCGHIRATLCDPQRFFAATPAARDWLAQHPGGTVLPVAEAYDELRSISDHILGEGQIHSCC